MLFHQSPEKDKKDLKEMPSKFTGLPHRPKIQTLCPLKKCLFSVRVISVFSPEVCLIVINRHIQERKNGNVLFLLETRV